MALIIYETPDAINSTYREIKFAAISDRTITTIIKAVRGDLYINGVYSTTMDGVQVLGTTNQFEFDIHKTMQSILVSELRTSDITTLTTSDATTSAVTIKMRFFEIYEDSGVFVTPWAVNGGGATYTESSNYDVVNMALQHQETLSDWTVDDATKKLLTLRTDNTTIPRGVDFQMGFLSSDTNLVGTVVQKDLNLNTITTTTSGTLASLTSSKGIIEIPSSLFSDPNTAFIEVRLRKISVADRSITYRFKVVDVCNKFTLFFQNHLGGFDHFDFGAKVVKNITTKNQTITKPLPSGFSSHDVGKSTLSSVSRTKIKVYSGTLSAADLDFVTELIKNHSVVYKWDSAGVFLRYIVTSHSTKVEDNDGFINSLSLTLEPSNDHITQTGD